jgi:hypothetical protein
VLFVQQFQIIFLSVFPSPTPPLSSCSPLNVAFFISQDLIHSINQKARTGIEETQDAQFFWNKDEGWWHNKSQEFWPAKKEDTDAALWDSQFDYDIYNGRQKGFSLKQVLSRTKKYVILQRQLTAAKIWADLRFAAELRRSYVYLHKWVAFILEEVFTFLTRTLQIFLLVHKIPA